MHILNKKEISSCLIILIFAAGVLVLPVPHAAVTVTGIDAMTDGMIDAMTGGMIDGTIDGMTGEMIDGMTGGIGIKF